MATKISRLIKAHSYVHYGAVLIILLVLTGCKPFVTIKSPQDGETFEVGQAIQFSGSARTFWEGKITGDSLSWTSNIDGKIGKGEDVITSSLSAGTHIITLSATNSSGEIGTEALSILVRQ